MQKHYDNLTYCADFYGPSLQLAKTVEELGELTAEVGRMLTFGRAENLREEIADVYNMLDQLCYLYACEDVVQTIAEEKMARQVQWIQEGQP